jgi:hypothetical protein
MSPSLLMNASLSIDVLARYMWIASPEADSGEPCPATVFMPWTKLTFSLSLGRGNGRHAIWVGETEQRGLEVENSEQSCERSEGERHACGRGGAQATYVLVVGDADEALVSDGRAHAVEPELLVRVTGSDEGLGGSNDIVSRAFASHPGPKLDPQSP